MIFNEEGEEINHCGKEICIGQNYSCTLLDGSVVDATLVEIRTSLDKWTEAYGYEFIVDIGDDDLILVNNITNDSFSF